MTFKARRDYFRGKPALDTIIVRGFEASKETLLAQFQAGDLQTLGAENLDVSDVDTIAAMSGVKPYVRAGTTIEHIDLNLENPILGDKSVRKALAFALDRQDLVNRVLSGQSTPADSLIPPISALFNPDTPKYAFNPDQAKSLLDAAGWAPGSHGIPAHNGHPLSPKTPSPRAALRQ